MIQPAVLPACKASPRPGGTAYGRRSEIAFAERRIEPGFDFAVMVLVENVKESLILVN